MLGIMGMNLDQVKYFFPVPAMLFISYYTQNYHTKILYFLIVHNLTPLYVLIVSDATVSSKLQAFSPIMLVLPGVGI
jgi:hypothetical protein